MPPSSTLSSASPVKVSAEAALEPIRFSTFAIVREPAPPLTVPARRLAVTAVVRSWKLTVSMPPSPSSAAVEDVVTAIVSSYDNRDRTSLPKALNVL